MRPSTWPSAAGPAPPWHLTLSFCLRVRWRGGAARGAHAVLVCSIVYLMVFNPVTEIIAYVMLGAVVASYAAAAWVNGRRRDAIGLAVLCVLLGIHLLESRPYALTRQWLKPLLALAFGAYFVVRAGSGGVPKTVPPVR